MASTLVGNASQGPARCSMLARRVHQIGPPGAMILERVPRPDPGPGEVLVDVHAAGVGPWDGWIRPAKARCRSLFLLRSALICPEQSRPWDPAFPKWLLEIRFSV